VLHTADYMQAHVGMRSLLLLAFALGSLSLACAPDPPAAGTDEKDATEKKGDEGDEKPTSKAAPAKTETPAAPAAAPPAAAKPPVTPPATPTNNTCETSRDLGSVNGDGDGKVTAEGRCSEWVRVRVVESDDSFSGEKLKVKVTLTPPTGADFELLAFVNTAVDVKECRAPSAASESDGDKPENVEVEWGESFVGNGADDSRTLSLHIKSVTGACTAEPWKLLIQGNP
jgi:hypothetical protein